MRVESATIVFKRITCKIVLYHKMMPIFLSKVLERDYKTYESVFKVYLSYNESI